MRRRIRYDMEVHSGSTLNNKQEITKNTNHRHTVTPSHRHTITPSHCCAQTGPLLDVLCESLLRDGALPQLPSIIFPSLNMIRHGRPYTLYCSISSLFPSVQSTFTTLSLPSYSLSAQTIDGATSLHGPHQAAWKSTMTGDAITGVDHIDGKGVL